MNNTIILVFVFFFFKQKTAYEMRISDWSSDVCSSDLRDAGLRPRVRQAPWSETDPAAHAVQDTGKAAAVAGVDLDFGAHAGAQRRCIGRQFQPHADRHALHHLDPVAAGRSEEHTSELQSLMRISYAVFCLKKKNIDKHNHPH